jgi:glycosyltransferase involved in cell wall biosynthesis
LLKPAADRGLDDPYFGREILWDVPLLDGYDHEFVPNVSANPGVGRFWGFRNPQLQGRVRDYNPDAVLLMGYNYWSLVQFILTWPTRQAPLILKGDSHRIVHTASLASSVKRILIKTLFRRFSAFLFVGQANKRYFALHGATDSKLFHSPHAIDNERFEAAALHARDAAEWRRGLGVPDKNLLVLFAGKLEPKKRPLDLLHAFLSLRRDDASLVLVGAGPLEAQLRNEAAGASNVHFSSFQNQSQMPRTYAACDLLVLPSYGPYETWGLAVNEAMCLGKPVIVSNHVGCAEDLVKSEVTGLVFEAGNRDALAAALTSALSDRARLLQWGANARELVRSYSYSEATMGLVSALECSMDSRSLRARSTLV